MLRARLRWTGELRAVGDVLREQAWLMVRSGFDSFAPADGSTAAQWTEKAARFRHVYQPAPDGREVAWDERASPFPLDGGRAGDGGGSATWAMSRGDLSEPDDHPPALIPSPDPSAIEGERR